MSDSGSKAREGEDFDKHGIISLGIRLSDSGSKARESEDFDKHSMPYLAENALRCRNACIRKLLSVKMEDLIYVRFYRSPARAEFFS